MGSTCSIDRFVERLDAIDISVVLHCNYPWVYLYEVNGNRVEGTHFARHGFCCFIGKKDGNYAITDRREVFKKIRDTL